MSREFIVRDDREIDLLAIWMKRQDLPLHVEAGPPKKKRTLSANSRLWLLHRMAAEFIGDSPEGLHEDMLCAFYGWKEIRMPSGNMKRVPLERSSDKEPQKFREFMDFCETKYASELGLWLDEMRAA